MRCTFLGISSFTFLALASTAMAAAPARLSVEVEGIAADQAHIPAKFALCQPTPDGKSKGSNNVRPTIRWKGAPSTVHSYTVLVTDPDVPASFDDAGKEGKTVKYDAPRQLFYHWALANIPVTTTAIEGGPSHTPPTLGTPAKGSLEKYVDVATQYGGPCPPWNDERVHSYHFTVYGLDVPHVELKPDATAEDVKKAIEGHIVAQGSRVGTYTLNAALAK